MIQTKQELINLLPTIYQNLNTPLFLISPDLKIDHQELPLFHPQVITEFLNQSHFRYHHLG